MTVPTSDSGAESSARALGPDRLDIRESGLYPGAPPRRSANRARRLGSCAAQRARTPFHEAIVRDELPDMTCTTFKEPTFAQLTLDRVQSQMYGEAGPHRWPAAQSVEVPSHEVKHWPLTTLHW